MFYTVREFLFGSRQQQSERKMAQAPPIIQDGILIYHLGEQTAQVVVDSADWYGWLEDASTFTFRSESGSFTAHKERAGNRRGRHYWRAYHTRHGRLQRSYLGQSETLTLSRLQAVAAQIFGTRVGETVLAVPAQDPEDAPRASVVSRAPAHLRKGTSPASHKLAEPEEIPPVRRSGPPGCATLPVPLTSLLGREREVEAVVELLGQPSVRLVTLTGTGGVGKTRLALHLAAALGDTFADGVWFVPLASISDPEQVMPAIAKALGLWESLDRPVLDHVRDHLREQRLLLLLDNFEHVAPASPQLTALLVSCPHLHLLVTSRAALHLSGEYVFPVPTLPTPALAELEETPALAELAAVRLFVERAHAVEPAFQLTGSNARAIAEICVRLDGLPLAIELAAARSRLLPPLALLKRLSHRLLVLTGGAHDLPARQQTLRNTLQWSYDLLTAEEQRLFRWLSIFVGGCTLQAAEAVCQEGGGHAFSVLEEVTSLIDKSLLRQTERDGEEPRLVMLEVLREFGLDCLQQEGELEGARQAHARYFLELAEQAEPHLLDSEQPLWFHRFEQDLDDLWTILQTAMTGEQKQKELALRLASALRYFWVGRGHLREGRDVLQRLLADIGATAATVRLKALNTLGMILWSQNDMRSLARVAEEELALAQEEGDQWRLTDAMIRRAAVLMDEHNYTQARLGLEEALASARVLGDRVLVLVAIAQLGRLAWYQHDAERAIACFEESLILSRAMGEKLLMSMVLVGLARAELSVGHFARVRTLLEESLTIYQALGNSWWVAMVLNLLGQLAFRQGELKAAKIFLTDSARMASQAGDQRNFAQSRLLLAGLAAQRGDYMTAREWYEEGLSIALEGGYISFLASGLKGLGCVAAAQGLSGWAAVLWGAAEPLRESSSVSIPEALYQRMLTVVRSQLGEPAFEEARDLGRALTPAQALVSHQSFAAQDAKPAQAALGTDPIAPARHSSSPGRLTTREMEVLRLVAQGMTNSQVAERLILSLHTVNAHVRSIYGKLQLNSRSALTRYALEHHQL
jgi:predicted ATPase/DNA-binding CsgD family transcriptional regulator/tetratricopeptide (TPR) repeat protein